MLGITECQIVSWAVKAGDTVAQFDPICEVSSDKATVEITSRFDGTIEQILYEEGEVAVVGQPILTLDVIDEEDVGILDLQASTARQQTSELPTHSPMPTSQRVKGDREVPVLPSIRHMLQSANIDIREVNGSGKCGRITKEDAERHILATNEKPPSISDSSNERVVLSTPMERAMHRSMTESLQIPHFSFSHTIDFTGVNKLRREHNSGNGSASLAVKLSPLVFVMKAISQSLTQFPKLNAHLDSSTTQDQPRLLLKTNHDFGIAVDTPRGLVIPVVREVGRHSLQSLAAEIKRLVELAQNNRLTPADLQGASFIVSNIGSIGGDVVAPVIMTPMIGIVAIGQLREVPAFNGGDIVRQAHMTLSWAADHRVVDGATVAKAAKATQLWLQDTEHVRHEMTL
ncbi:hypothetical protein LTR56_006392 [Elasticomyces elasticus]|nr:hypothetical protein LTR56_006392 [Elasticomyces elasticus]KAK3663437.1 hypothetical protein LTR22_005847 [Elasticomyces elasticus]KAK4925516.1 hypothetical protein LTR49_007583 [Elasticomyces elasticus]KAK5764611.1 hypothetical protein LTS12_005344 [Elasticomyces elasticus]